MFILSFSRISKIRWLIAAYCCGTMSKTFFPVDKHPVSGGAFSV